jgi:hypothetical protein
LHNICLRIKPLTALAGKNISPIDPDFNANYAKGGMRLGTIVIDIGTQSLQRHLALNLFLCAGNFCPTQASSNNYFDAFGVCTHRLLYSLLHSTAERDTLL